MLRSVSKVVLRSKLLRPATRNNPDQWQKYQRFHLKHSWYTHHATARQGDLLCPHVVSSGWTLAAVLVHRVLQSSPSVLVPSHQQSVLTTRLHSLCSVVMSLSLSVSLLHSGSTTSQGMFQHATNSRTRPMSMLLDQRGRIRERGREGGNPEKKKTQRDSGCFGKWACTAFTFNAFNSWSHCERMHQHGYCLWHSESRFSYKSRAWKV